MAIQKKESFRIIISIAVLFLTLPIAAAEDSAYNILIKSYKVPQQLTEKTAEQIIADLQGAIGNCDNKQLRCRLKYRIGMLHFKANSFPQASSCFERLIDEDNYSDLIRICSLNMAAQIARMEGKDQQAFAFFDNLITTVDKFLENDTDSKDILVPLKLFTMASFAKAEMYQYQQHYKDAAKQYEMLIDVLQTHPLPELHEYLPLAKDKLSQLKLMGSDFKGYFSLTKELAEQFPDYERTPIAQFEAKAVEFIKSIAPHTKFTRGGFDAPAILIGYAKNKGKSAQLEEFLLVIENLSKKYKGTHGGLILSYHYASLLDSLGETEKCSVVLAKIVATKSASDTKKEGQLIEDMIIEYAKIQYALILGEILQYTQALKVASTVKTSKDNQHLLELTQSIKKSLETLKREVPIDSSCK